MIKRVFDSNQRNYVKDIEFSYKPFMPVLGNGLITSKGDLWQKQRVLLSSAFRIEILEETAVRIMAPAIYVVLFALNNFGKSAAFLSTNTCFYGCACISEGGLHLNER